MAQNKNKNDRIDKQIEGSLRLIGFISKNTKEMSLKETRRFLKNVRHIEPFQKIPTIYKIMNAYSETVQDFLKTLILMHLMIQEMEVQCLEFQDFFIDEINNCLGLTKELIARDNQQSKKEGAFSLEKTLGWIKNTFSTSKEKKSVKKSDLKDFSQRKRINSEKDLNPKGQTKEEFIYYNFIVPYASFLQKLMQIQLVVHCLKDRMFKKEEIWQMINFLKSLIKVSKEIPIILRYYKKQFSCYVLFFIKVADYDLKTKYYLMQPFLNSKNSVIQKRYKEFLRKSDFSLQRKKQFLENIKKEEQIEELTRILDEINIVNQGILHIYYGRYQYQQIEASGIRCIKFIKTMNDFQCPYQILKSSTQMDKSLPTKQEANNIHKMKQKLVESKKSLKIDRQQKKQKTTISKINPFSSSSSSSFAQLRLKKKESANQLISTYGDSLDDSKQEKKISSPFNNKFKELKEIKLKANKVQRKLKL